MRWWERVLLAIGDHPWRRCICGQPAKIDCYYCRACCRCPGQHPPGLMAGTAWMFEMRIAS